jgi:hypothetical protein
VTVGSKVVLVGGIDARSHVRQSEVLDGGRWTDAAAIPTMRDHLAAATDGRLVYVAGGRAGGRSVDAFEAFDVQTNTWRALPRIPTARSGFGAVFIGGRIVTAGGELQGIFGDVEAYDVTARTWIALTPMRTPRHGHGVVAIGRTMMTFVGGDKAGSSASRTCEALDL